MDTLRTTGTRSSALWGKNVGRRTRALAAAVVVCGGLALASAPIAGAANGHGHGSKAVDLSQIDASWAQPDASATGGACASWA